jgi:hypothetical protein
MIINDFNYGSFIKGGMPHLPKSWVGSLRGRGLL